MAAVALAALAALLTPAHAAAAATDVVISEIMYNAGSGRDGDEFVELTNTGRTDVDLSGWCFGGVTLCLPAEARIGARGRFVVARDAVRFAQQYDREPDAVFTGGLSNGGETLSLRDAAGTVIETVTYSDRDPWPTVADGLGPSLQLLDPTQDSADPLNWAAATGTAQGSTPGAVNSLSRSGLAPRVSAVTASPQVPAPRREITVSATVTDRTAAVLRYRVDYGSERTVTMRRAGDTFTATIPGQSAGRLVRYRVEATNGSGTTTWPRPDDSSAFAGVVVDDGVQSAIPVLRWFVDDADYDLITTNPTVDIVRTAVVEYQGQVFDGALVSIRGQTSVTAPKPNWKIELPKNHELTFAGTAGPVDEFAMQADVSDSSHGRPLLAWDSYRTTGVVNTQVFPLRVQRNGRFQGLYTYVDLFDGTWRDREGYDDAQFFKSGTKAFEASVPLVENRFAKKNPEDGDYTPVQSFLDVVALTGAARRAGLLAAADLPQMINYAVTTAVVEHTDSSSKNWYLSQDEDTGRWSIIPWDLDHTYGNDCCAVESDFVTPAEPGDQTSPLMQAILAEPQWRQMYFRRLRTVVDEVLAPGRLEALYDSAIGPAEPEATLDFEAWPREEDLTYAGQRAELFAELRERRAAFADDPRVPDALTVLPRILVNEIQPSTAAGSGGEFVELFNTSSTQAVDLSGWTIGGGIELTVQPGTVILPRSTMTFVKDDLAFRSRYGSDVFVGGTYSGTLDPTDTLTLRRADGSRVTSFTYGGADWPDATSGRSLEVRLRGTNGAPANWSLSVAPRGTPGAANRTAVTGGPAAAPDLVGARPGDLSATVRWTPPADTGGNPLTGFVVRTLDADGAPVGDPLPAGPDRTSLVVGGLVAGTQYRFDVAAVTVAGPGTVSAQSVPLTPLLPQTPSRPGIGVAESGDGDAEVTAKAVWTAPAEGSSPILIYRVTALRMSSTAADATVLGRIESIARRPQTRAYKFPLARGVYRFEVAALNAAGWSPVSQRSAPVTAR